MPDDKAENRIALIYVRVSSKSQDPKSQVIRCEQYCQQKGYTIEKIFKDKFTGGGDFMHRPAMKELLDYVCTNTTKKYVVVFDDIKRFARDVEFHLKLRAVFTVYDLKPECLNYNFDDSPEGRFMETIHAAQSELERHQNRRQVIQKQQARLSAGYNAFRAPPGYTKYEKIPEHGTLDKLNEKGLIIKQALKKFAKGNLPEQIDVARYLKEKAVFGKQAPVRYLDNVKRLLTNVFYAGYIEHKERGIERRKGHHEALISLQEFNQIQKRVQVRERKFPIRRSHNPAFPLRGCVNCGYCHKPYTAAKSKGNGGLYYKYFCQNKECPLRAMDNVLKSVDNKKLESGFKQLVQKYSPSTKIAKKAAALLQLGIDQSCKEDIFKKEKIKLEKKQCEKEMEHLIELASKPTLSDTVRKRYEEQVEKLDQKLQDLAKKMEEKLDTSKSYRTKAKQVIEMLKSPYEIWASQEIAIRKKLFYFIFEENLEYIPGRGYRTIKLALPIRVFEEIRTANSRDVDIVRPLLNQFEQYVNHWYEQFPNSLDGNHTAGTPDH